jgi:hypothetical protein
MGKTAASFTAENLLQLKGEDNLIRTDADLAQEAALFTCLKSK